MVDKKKLTKYCLRVIDLLDIIGLIIVNAIAIKKYQEREKYAVSSFFLVN